MFFPVTGSTSQVTSPSATISARVSLMFAKPHLQSAATRNGREARYLSSLACGTHSVIVKL